ncbi:hypothetical protein V494_04200 [Pseudogymnoascus sp. VKM F-4513 (FW-928)]|nr:hypothetical protein V494_04200 [Pseudogymnoascus sp. VKM F-4513 (FW-928)]
MTRRLSLPALVDESVLREVEDGENKLISVIEQVKCTLTDLLSSKGVKDDTQMKEKLNNFQSLEAGTVEFMLALKSLIEDLAHYINEEEMVDLPALDKALSSKHSNNLERAFHRTKSTVAWMLAAPFDQLSDLFRKFPDETFKISGNSV